MCITKYRKTMLLSICMRFLKINLKTLKGSIAIKSLKNTGADSNQLFCIVLNSSNADETLLSLMANQTDPEFEIMQTSCY